MTECITADPGIVVAFKEANPEYADYRIRAKYALSEQQRLDLLKAAEDNFLIPS